MSTIDLATILSNISQSFVPVEQMMTALSYVLGILFVISGLFKLTKIKARSREHVSAPLVCILGGGVLIYLPSSIEVMSTTFFGSSNILQYSKVTTITVYDSVKLLVQTAGLIWFIRGTVLLVHAAEPGKQHGIKGMLFVVAGIFAMNLDFTVSAIDQALTYLMSLGMQAV